jgi:phage/plasmid-associated DNA primase
MTKLIKETFSTYLPLFVPDGRSVQEKYPDYKDRIFGFDMLTAKLYRFDNREDQAKYIEWRYKKKNYSSHCEVLFDDRPSNMYGDIDIKVTDGSKFNEDDANYCLELIIGDIIFQVKKHYQTTLTREDFFLAANHGYAQHCQLKYSWRFITPRFFFQNREENLKLMTYVQGVLPLSINTYVDLSVYRLFNFRLPLTKKPKDDRITHIISHPKFTFIDFFIHKIHPQGKMMEEGEKKEEFQEIKEEINIDNTDPLVFEKIVKDLLDSLDIKRSVEFKFWKFIGISLMNIGCYHLFESFSRRCEKGEKCDFEYWENDFLETTNKASLKYLLRLLEEDNPTKFLIIKKMVDQTVELFRFDKRLLKSHAGLADIYTQKRKTDVYTLPKGDCVMYKGGYWVRGKEDQLYQDIKDVLSQHITRNIQIIKEQIEIDEKLDEDPDNNVMCEVDNKEEEIKDIKALLEVKLQELKDKKDDDIKVLSKSRCPEATEIRDQYRINEKALRENTRLKINKLKGEITVLKKQNKEEKKKGKEEKPECSTDFINQLEDDPSKILKSLGKVLASIGSTPTIINILSQVRPKMLNNDFEDLIDKQKAVFAFSNGKLYDFNLARERKIEKNDYITNYSKLTYQPLLKEDNDFVEKYFRLIFDNDEEKIKSFQRTVGYSLTKFTKERIMVFLTNVEGAGGKDTTCDMVMAVNNGVGDDKIIIGNNKAILKTADSSASSHTAHLNSMEHKTLVIFSEPDKGKKINFNAVKSMIGTKKQTIRNLGQEERQALWTAKPWLMCNQIPDLDDTTTAEDKIIVYQFPVTFAKEFKGRDNWRQGDPNIADKISLHINGFLHWCLKGAVDYMKEGLYLPDCVSDTLKEYLQGQQDLNYVKLFMEDKLNVGKGKTKASVLHSEFVSYCKGEKNLPHHEVLNATAFGLEIKRLGMKVIKSNYVHYLCEIKPDASKLTLDEPVTFLS